MCSGANGRDARRVRTSSSGHWGTIRLMGGLAWKRALARSLNSRSPVEIQKPTWRGRLNEFRYAKIVRGDRFLSWKVSSKKRSTTALLIAHISLAVTHVWKYFQTLSCWVEVETLNAPAILVATVLPQETEKKAFKTPSDVGRGQSGRAAPPGPPTSWRFGGAGGITAGADATGQRRLRGN